MYAVIETGGKQYRVEIGTELAVERLDVEPGQSITLDRVLLVADGAEASIGQPLVDGASVAAEVVRQDRADKVIAFKYRPKARRRVKKGHRQEQTILRVTDVVLGGRSAAEAARQAEAAAKTERERLEEAAARQAAEDAALAAKLAARAAKAAKAEAGEGVATSAPAEGAAEPPKARPSRAKTAPAPSTGAAEETEAPAPAPKRSRAKAAPSEPAAPGDQPAQAVDEPSTAPKRSRTKKDE